MARSRASSRLHRPGGTLAPPVARRWHTRRRNGLSPIRDLSHRKANLQGSRRAYGELSLHPRSRSLARIRHSLPRMSRWGSQGETYSGPEEQGSGRSKPGRKPRPTRRARRHCDGSSHQLCDPVALSLLSQQHSTPLPPPKRYEMRYGRILLASLRKRITASAPRSDLPDHAQSCGAAPRGRAGSPSPGRCGGRSSARRSSTR
jgi:hypothetical protein